MIKETSLSNLQVLVGKVLPAWNPCFSTFSGLLSSVWPVCRKNHYGNRSSVRQPYREPCNKHVSRVN
jgi:hypothetical protein